MGPDQGSTGTGVSQRLISEEPMAIILNLGISRMFIYLHTYRYTSLTSPRSKLADDKFGIDGVPCNYAHRLRSCVSAIWADQCRV
jgi:hypothetical protein